jgi:hypothetical protein
LEGILPGVLRDPCVENLPVRSIQSPGERRGSVEGILAGVLRDPALSIVDRGWVFPIRSLIPYPDRRPPETLDGGRGTVLLY